MKRAILTLICLVAAFGMKAQTLNVINTTNCEVNLHSLHADDVGVCSSVPPYTNTSLWLLPANMTTPLSFTAMDLTPMPSGAFEWLRAYFGDADNAPMCPHSGGSCAPHLASGKCVSGIPSTSCISITSPCNSCLQGTRVNMSWTDQPNGDVDIVIY